MNSNRKTLVALLLGLATVLLLWHWLPSLESSHLALSAARRAAPAPLQREPVQLEAFVPPPERPAPPEVAVEEKKPRSAISAPPVPEPEPEAEPVLLQQSGLRPARMERKRFTQVWTLTADLVELRVTGIPASPSALEGEARVIITSKVQVLDHYEAESLGAPPRLVRVLEEASESTSWGMPLSPDVPAGTRVLNRSSPWRGEVIEFEWDSVVNAYAATGRRRRARSTRYDSGQNRPESVPALHTLKEDMDLRLLAPPPPPTYVGYQWELSEEAFGSLLHPGGDWGWEGEVLEGGATSPGGPSFAILPVLTSPVGSYMLGTVERAGVALKGQNTSADGKRRSASGAPGALGNAPGSSGSSGSQAPVQMQDTVDTISFEFEYEIDSQSQEAWTPTDDFAIQSDTPSMPTGGVALIQAGGRLAGSGQLDWRVGMQRFESFRATANVEFLLRTELSSEGLAQAVSFSMPVKGKVEFAATCVEVAEEVGARELERRR